MKAETDIRRRPCDSKGRDWRGQAASQGTARIASKALEARGKQHMIPLPALEGALSSGTLILDFLASTTARQ